MNSNSLTKTRTEIADEFGISVRTLPRWLSQHQVIMPRRQYLFQDEYERVYGVLKTVQK